MTGLLAVKRAGSVAIVLCVLGAILAEPRSADVPPTSQATETRAHSLQGCGRADPFAPLIRKADAARRPEPGNGPARPEDGRPHQGALSLIGIIWSERRPQAIINDTLLDVGDTVTGRTVLTITRDAVVLGAAGRKEALKVETPSCFTVVPRAPGRGTVNGTNGPQ